MSEVDQILAKACFFASVKTDTELSEFLRIPYKVLTGWKTRGHIPEKRITQIALALGIRPDALLVSGDKDREMTVREELDRLKSRLKIKTDRQLAVALSTTEASIDKWISKKAVPQKWQRIIALLFPEPQTDFFEEHAFKAEEEARKKMAFALSEDDGISTEKELPVEVVRYWLEAELCEYKRLDALIAKLEFDLAQASRDMERSERKINLARSVLNSRDPDAEISDKELKVGLIRAFSPQSVSDPIEKILALLRKD